MIAKEDLGSSCPSQNQKNIFSQNSLNKKQYSYGGQQVRICQHKISHSYQRQSLNSDFISQHQ